MCKAKLSHLAFADSHFCQREFVSDGLTCGIPRCIVFYPSKHNSLFFLLPAASLHENLEPFQAYLLHSHAADYYIPRHTCVKIPILLFPHGIYHFESTSSRYVNRWHSSFYTDILRSMYEVYTRGRDKEYIIERYRPIKLRHLRSRSQSQFRS